MASIDRWVSAMVGDDGIDMPLSGGGPSIEATVFAREDGLIVGCAVVDYILQIWAPSVRVSWFAGDGKRVSSGGTKSPCFRVVGTMFWPWKG